MRSFMTWLAMVASLSCTGATTAAGTWTGHTTGEGSTSTLIRFVIVDSDGALTGKMLFEDPETHEFVEAPDVVGDRSGNQLTWRSSTGTKVTGVVEGSTIRGTITYQAKPDLELGEERYGLELKR
jgi:hypothetical protein